MGLPSRVKIVEVGPREGFQMEKNIIPTEQKVNFINQLSQTGLSHIEVTSLVNPKRVPQMADADELLSSIQRVGGVSYSATYLNEKGLERAIENNVDFRGKLVFSASNEFSKANMNKSIDEMFAGMKNWIKIYQNVSVPVSQIGVMAAFGCNYEGRIALDHVMQLLQKAMNIAREHGEMIHQVRLADTLGWANPTQIKKTIFAIKNKWPHVDIALHLHDTRGLGLANANAALEEGVVEFDAAVGGLGGCPFAKVKGAPGNICTEDFVFLCEEQGVSTGVNLEALLECSKMAEEMIGRELPGHLLKGGLFTN